MKKKIPIFFLTISVLIFFYIFLKSEIIWLGNKRDYYLTYYIIFFAFLIFSFSTFFINNEVNKIFFISILTILTSAYAAEIYLHLKNNFYKDPGREKRIKIYNKNNTIPFDGRKKIQVYKDLKKNDKNVSVIMYPRNFLSNDSDIFFLQGIRNSNTISCNEDGYYAIDKSDRYGFNNSDYLWDLENIDILILGDSFAYGECVNRKNNFATNLSKYGGNLSVINLGMGGYGPLSEYATLKEFAPQNYNKILWFYFEGNDPTDLLGELSNKILSKYLNDDNFTQNLKFKTEIAEKELRKRLKNITKEFQRNEFFKIDYIQIIKLFRLRYLFKKEKDNQIPYVQLEKIFKKTQSLTKKNSDFFLIYIPNNQKFKKNKKHLSKDYKEIIKITKKLNINFIDLNEYLFNNKKNISQYYPFIVDNGHFSPYGYSDVSKFIISKITK